MKRKENIEAEIEKTLASLDNFPKTKADAFFYTRLSAKLEAANEPLIIKWFFDTPYLKPSLLILFLAINIITTVSWINSTTKDNSSLSNITETFMEEYELIEGSETFLVLNEE